MPRESPYSANDAIAHHSGMGGDVLAELTPRTIGSSAGPALHRVEDKKARPIAEPGFPTFERAPDSNLRPTSEPPHGLWLQSESYPLGLMAMRSGAQPRFRNADAPRSGTAERRSSATHGLHIVSRPRGSAWRRAYDRSGRKNRDQFEARLSSFS